MGAVPSKSSGKSLTTYVSGSSAARACTSSRRKTRRPPSAIVWRTRTLRHVSSPLFDFAQTDTQASHPSLTVSPASTASAKPTGLMQARQLIFDGLLELLPARNLIAASWHAVRSALVHPTIAHDEGRLFRLLDEQSPRRSSPRDLSCPELPRRLGRDGSHE